MFYLTNGDNRVKLKLGVIIIEAPFCDSLEDRGIAKMFPRVSALSIFGLSLVILLLPISFGEDIDEAEENDKKISYRLPNDTRPVTYDLHFITNIHKCELEYTGNAVIKIAVLNDTDKIVIHGKNLSQIKTNLVNAVDGSEFENITYNYDNETAFLTIYSAILPLDLKAGKEYILTIRYKSYLSKEPRGFFRTKYKSPKKSEVCFAMTDFEPTYARTAFPCYDEPSFKARFVVTITHGSNYSAISSMPVDGEPIESQNGMTTTIFRQTPLMSPYYIAFGIIKHEKITVKRKNVTHSVYSPPESIHKGEFALQIAADAINALEDYLEINFTLPKIDHISVRKRFGQAMENWGLIVYDDAHLLPYSNNSNFLNMRIALVITHELTHQWFGNLVSPKWWSYIWLSEGLTTFYSHKILNKIRPEWEVLDYLIFSELSPSFFSSYSRTPVTNYAETERQIERRFGMESYDIAAYILFMFEKALTEATFRKGVINYLRKLQFSVADEDDLFDSLQEAAIEDQIDFFKEPGAVSKSMKTWTHQCDYPIVTVTRDYENGSFTLQQNRFSNKNDTEIESDYLWYIPITFATASSPDFYNLTTDFVFPNERNITVTPDRKPLLNNEWVILNKRQIGTYRVQYDERNWKLIIKALKQNPAAINSYNKAQLLRDAVTFAKAGNLPEQIFIDLLLCLKDDDDLVTWTEIEKTLYDMRGNLTGVGSNYLFKFFAQNIISNIFDKILSNSKNENILREHFRSVLFSLACEINLEKCIKVGRELFDDLITNKTDVDFRFKVEIYRQGFKHCKKEDFESLLKLFEQEEDILEQTALIQGLVMSENMKFIAYLAANLINKTSESSEDNSVEEEDGGVYLYQKYLEDWQKYA